MKLNVEPQKFRFDVFNVSADLAITLIVYHFFFSFLTHMSVNHFRLALVK